MTRFERTYPQGRFDDPKTRPKPDKDIDNNLTCSDCGDDNVAYYKLISTQEYGYIIYFCRDCIFEEWEEYCNIYLPVEFEEWMDMFDIAKLP